MQDHLRRAIQKYLEDPLSEEILKGNFKDVGKVKVKYKKGSEELTFTDDRKERVLIKKLPLKSWKKRKRIGNNLKC